MCTANPEAIERESLLPLIIKKNPIGDYISGRDGEILITPVKPNNFLVLNDKAILFQDSNTGVAIMNEGMESYSIQFVDLSGEIKRWEISGFGLLFLNDCVALSVFPDSE